MSADERRSESQRLGLLILLLLVVAFTLYRLLACEGAALGVGDPRERPSRGVGQSPTLG